MLNTKCIYPTARLGWNMEESGSFICSISILAHLKPIMTTTDIYKISSITSATIAQDETDCSSIIFYSGISLYSMISNKFKIKLILLKPDNYQTNISMNLEG